MTLESLSLEAYEDAIAALPPSVHFPIEQSGIWTRTITEPHRSVYGLFVFRENGEPVAFLAAERFVRQIRESIVSLNGPIFTAERTPVRERELVRLLAEHIRADSSVNPSYIRLQLQFPEAVKGAVESIERGTFEREVVVRLENTPEDLKKTYSSTTRNLVNRARRARVRIEEITQNRAEFFAEHCYPIMQETGARDGFNPPPLEFIQRVLTVIPEHVRLYVAYAPAPDAQPDAVGSADAAASPAPASPEKPLGWVMSDEYRGTGCYYLAASSAEAQKLNVMPALVNHLLVQLRESGNTIVGLTGIGSKRWPEFARLERFKLSFSKEIVEYPALYDVPLNAPKYWAVRSWILGKGKAGELTRTGLQQARSGARKAQTAGKKALPAARQAAGAVKAKIGR